MSKKFKYIFLILILLSFGTSVNADRLASVCYTTPGGTKDNKVVIPKDYAASCVYTLDTTKSGTITKTSTAGVEEFHVTDGSYTTDDNYNLIYLNFYKYVNSNTGYYDVISLHGHTGSVDVPGDYDGGTHLIDFTMYPNDNKISAVGLLETDPDNPNTNLNGLYLTQGEIFTNNNSKGSVKYESTGNCPKSIYWVFKDISGNANKTTDSQAALFRFTDKVMVSDVDKQNNVGSTVVFYNLAFDEYDDELQYEITLFPTTNEYSDHLNKYGLMEAPFCKNSSNTCSNPPMLEKKEDGELLLYYDYIKDRDKGCHGTVLEPNNNNGHDSNEQQFTEISNYNVECDYFFDELNHDNVYNCYDVTITYSISKLKNNQTGEIKTVFSSDNNHSAFGWYLNESRLKDENGYILYGRLNDFIVWDDKTQNYICADKNLYAYMPTVDTWLFMSDTDYRENNCRVFAGCDEDQIIETRTEPRGECVELPIPGLTPTPRPTGGSSGGYIDFDNISDVNCNGILGDLLPFIKKIFKWIQIIAPIFVVIISSAEFAGSLLQDDKDALKKASNRFMKRLIIAVALFFIPMILSFVFDIFNSVAGRFVDTCI